MASTTGGLPMNKEELLYRLRADKSYDAAVLRIGEADYGCEELPDGAQERVWLLLLLPDGSECSMERPGPLVDRLGLTEGALCRLSDLEG